MQNAIVLAIIGPTASGKTDISFLLANLIKEKLELTPEIISTDSRQVYKGIKIASSQPPEKYLLRFKHYFVNSLDPETEFNAGQFGSEARNIIGNIIKENKIPIIVGGSGLYLRSLIYGLFDVNDINDDESVKLEQKRVRKLLYERLEKEGIELLYNELMRIDQESASKMTISNTRRIIRALEIYYITGIPISTLQKKKINVGFSAVQFGILWERKKLYERINKRVDLMFENGLNDEIAVLKEKGYDYSIQNSLNTVGVKEVFDYQNGKISYTRMVELIKQNTRRFAKRQMTWFRKDKNIKWINVEEEGDFTRIASEIFTSFFEKTIYS
jgi:tRNA dimethylallyltransferase